LQDSSIGIEGQGEKPDENGPEKKDDAAQNEKGPKRKINEIIEKLHGRYVQVLSRKSKVK
jgi:hypothetical protein